MKIQINVDKLVNSKVGWEALNDSFRVSTADVVAWVGAGWCAWWVDRRLMAGTCIRIILAIKTGAMFSNVIFGK